jgi:HPt (histidine-containing phosphotransfer) domain-containing protein
VPDGPQSDAAPAIDDAVLAEVLESTGGDREFLAELIGTYLDDAPRRLAAIRQALVDGAADDVARAAHALKGASGSLGATGLAQQSRALEMAAKEGRLADAERQVTALEAEFERVAEALRAV